MGGRGVCWTCVFISPDCKILQGRDPSKFGKKIQNAYLEYEGGAIFVVAGEELVVDISALIATHIFRFLCCLLGGFQYK